MSDKLKIKMYAFGRGYRIRKRSNHVTLFVDSKSNNEDQN